MKTIPCEYCGVEASQKDCLLPNYVYVDCCEECYFVIKILPLQTLAERRRIIKRYLRSQYHSVLSTPEWTTTELAQLGPNLRQHIEGTQNLKQFVLSRLAW